MKRDILILKPMDFNKLKNEVKKNKDRKIVFCSSDDELNRKVIDKLLVKGVMILLEDRRDYLKQRDSGFNEVMAKLAKKRGIDIYFNFEELFFSKNKERILARLKQNIELCVRVKLNMRVFMGDLKKSEVDVKSLFLTLGAPTWMVKNLFLGFSKNENEVSFK